MVTESVWVRERRQDLGTPLRTDVRADVCVIGAGMAGLSIAQELVRRGHKTVLVDDGPLAGGESERTTAHLASALDDRFVNLERWIGDQGARLAHERHAAAIDRIEALAHKLVVDCDFRRLDGYLLSETAAEAADLDAEIGAARRCGVKGLRRLATGPVDTFHGPAARFPDQAQFRPMPYYEALARDFVDRGGALYRPVHATKLDLERPPHGVSTDTGGTVTAEHVIVATNAPIVPRVRFYLKVHPYRTYAVAAPIERGALAPALYWDLKDPYHYVRLRDARPKGEGDDVLIAGGEDHRVGQGPKDRDPFAQLDRWTHEHFPAAQASTHRWSGQVMEPVDGLAYIGKLRGHEGVWIATGDSGHGMTHGTIAGELIPALLDGEAPDWARVFSPDRMPWTAWRDLIRENAASAQAYARWATTFSPAAHLLPGEGEVVWSKGGPVAHCVDATGAEHHLSAVCPHLGCIVGWNRAEASWDCPCHGSRYDADGRVLNGPSNSDLARGALSQTPTTSSGLPKGRPRSVGARHRKGCVGRRIVRAEERSRPRE